MATAVRFGVFTFDTGSAELRRSGLPVHLQAQPAQVLRLLVTRAGEVVSREEIRRHVWQDRWAEFDQGINTCISQIRSALGDSATSPLYIETIPRTGYRFIAEVRPVESPPVIPARRSRWPLLAAATAGAVLIMVLGLRGPRVSSHPVAAREAVSRGEYLLGRRTSAAAASAIAQFDLALSIDSTYAEAWVGLARSRLASEADPRRVVPAVREAVEHALRLSPRLGPAHAERARLQFWFDWDWRGAERSFRRALELDSRSAPAHHDFALLLAALGRTDEALARAMKARELDPASPAIATDIGVVYYLMRRYEDAWRAAQRALEVEAGYRPALTLLYATALRQQRPDAAMVYARQFMPASLLPAEVASGDVNDERAILAVAEALLAWLARSPGAAESNVLRAQQHVILGQPDSAMAWLDRGYAERERWMVFAGVEPGLDPLRADPRFARLVQRMGLQANAQVQAPAGLHFFRPG